MNAALAKDKLLPIPVMGKICLCVMAFGMTCFLQLQ